MESFQYIYNELKKIYETKKISIWKINGYRTIELIIRRLEKENICIYICIGECNTPLSLGIGESYYWRTEIKFSPDAKDKIIQLCKRIDKEYDNLQKAFLLAAKKKCKLIEIAVANIMAIIPNIMLQTNHEWNLVEENDRFLLQIKTKHHKMIEISLNEKNFVQKMPEIPSAITQIERFLESAPFPVDIKNYDNNILWKRS